jgi:hypothetical protein
VAELQDTMDKMQVLTAERADTHKQVGTLGSLPSHMPGEQAAMCLYSEGVSIVHAEDPHVVGR